MNDIEAAARAVVEANETIKAKRAGRPPNSSITINYGPLCAAADALRSALAHAARGEGDPIRDALVRLDKAAEWFDNAGATAVHGGPEHDEGCIPCEAIIDLRLARRAALSALHPAPTPPGEGEEAEVHRRLDEAARVVKPYYNATGAFVGGPGNWIAPVHACPKCGKSLNWREFGGGIVADCACGRQTSYLFHPTPPPATGEAGGKMGPDVLWQHDETGRTQLCHEGVIPGCGWRRVYLLPASKATGEAGTSEVETWTGEAPTCPRCHSHSRHGAINRHGCSFRGDYHPWHDAGKEEL